MMLRSLTACARAAASVFARFGADRTGAILVELAFAIPILGVLTLGGYEICRFILLQQKLEGVAVEVADLVAQYETITAADVDNIFLAVDHIATPFSFESRGVVIVSSVSKASGGPIKIDWQRSGGGTASATSQIGTVGGTATLPTGFVVRDNESVIIAEVFYHYDPVLETNLIPMQAADLYHQALMRPRFGALSTLN
jgi:Flp pilus assembly protein TadG